MRAIFLGTPWGLWGTKVTRPQRAPSRSRQDGKRRTRQSRFDRPKKKKRVGQLARSKAKPHSFTQSTERGPRRSSCSFFLAIASNPQPTLIRFSCCCKTSSRIVCIDFRKEREREGKRLLFTETCCHCHRKKKTRLPKCPSTWIQCMGTRCRRLCKSRFVDRHRFWHHHKCRAALMSTTPT